MAELSYREAVRDAMATAMRKDEARRLREERDPIELLRAKIEISDDDFSELDAEVTEIVEAAVEFAKAASDPAPEDALKNVYA